jgi:transcriptional regulator with XRE-family HTH domain
MYPFAIMIADGYSSMLGRALKRWRLLHRVKQAHAAELLGVAQTTISRWEAGRQAIDPETHDRLETLLAAKFQPQADHALALLVREVERPIHLICDLTHRLLACSNIRRREFGVQFDQLTGQSLWRYATRAVREAELATANAGWGDSLLPAPFEFETGANNSTIVPIRQSRCRWTRFILSDGSIVRLVETL